jgi:mono/diheme cytochrome c family protein
MVPVVTMPLSVVSQGDAGGCQTGSLPPPPAGTPGSVTPPPGQVVAVAYQPNGVVVSQSRDPAVLWTSDGQSPIQLSDAATTDTGHRLFHVDAGGGIACASCHPEGGEDGRVWSFACLGPRRTQALRGGLSGTEPFHWDGDMQTFPDLVQAVFVGRMSGPQPSADQTAALLRWLDGVPELPNPPPASAAAAAHGRTLFESATLGCTACHAGPHLTNNLTVDVGTGMKVQVPSLRGVGWRAPFLHDGCAPSLADRFGSCGGGDKHGHTSDLSPADVSDLTAYLETL